MSVSEAERFDIDLKTHPELQDGLKQHVGSMADVVAFAGSRGYSFTVEEAKQYKGVADGSTLDDAKLDAVAGGASTPVDKVLSWSWG